MYTQLYLGLFAIFFFLNKKYDAKQRCFASYLCRVLNTLLNAFTALVLQLVHRAH